MWIIGLFASSVIKAISDLFTRTTSGSLGTTTSGHIWTSIRGTWYANGTNAQSDDAASSYPIAAIRVNKNANVSADVSIGTGVAFWVTDANSWWASTYIATQSSTSYSCNPYSCNPYSCNCSTSYYNCNPYYCNPYSCNPYSCNCSTTYSCGTGTYLSGTYCYFYTNDAPCCAASASTTCQMCYQTCYYTCYQTCSSTTCSTCYDTCYQTCTNTTTNYYLQLLKSVSGTVSEATGSISLGAAAAAIAVQTANGTITAKAYSDSAKTTQVGTTMSLTPVSPVQGQYVGIIKTTSANLQSNLVDNFAATI